MKTLRFTLLAEGTSDRVLLPILRWMLLRHHKNIEWMGTMAELHALPNTPRMLPERIAATCELFPSDVLFIHRDSDREATGTRRNEISEAVEALAVDSIPSWIPVIPVRMTEAWLLISESALRAAAGNPNGQIGLSLPSGGRLEAIPDPKQILNDLLLEASGLTGRRRKKFHFPAARARIPDFFDDWQRLLHLPSAKMLDDEIAGLSLGVDDDSAGM
jgi:hypothetical protein